MRHSSYGYLKYNPISETTRNDPWWLTVECSTGLASLYQSLIYKDASKIVKAKEVFGYGDWLISRKMIRVHKSVWGPHISIVRGEEPENKRAWNKYNGKKVWFDYSPFVGTNGCHYWLPVESDEFLKIREELGLPRFSLAPFHLTIGRDIEAPPAKHYRLM